MTADMERTFWHNETFAISAGEGQNCPVLTSHSRDALLCMLICFGSCCRPAVSVAHWKHDR